MLRAVWAGPIPILAVAVAVGLTGCGSEGPADTGDAGKISYGSFGTRADIDCGNGKSLTVGGSNNTLTVTGRCVSVSVGGADNTIRLERVDGDLSVVGLNNTVSYRDGEPNVDDSGSGNRIGRV